ncbi:MAG: hypothetical protein WB630_22560 [Candidatus Acidiferrales bacterium]
MSSKSFDQFVEFFFARKVAAGKEQFDYFPTDLAQEQYHQAVPSDPTKLVKHMTKLFSNFAQMANKYSLAQVDQAIWAIGGARLRLYRFLFEASIPLQNRLECIRSTYFVYSDFVGKSKEDPDPSLTGFFMYWDLVLDGFWTPSRPFVPRAPISAMRRNCIQSRTCYWMSCSKQ